MKKIINKLSYLVLVFAACSSTKQTNHVENDIDVTNNDSIIELSSSSDSIELKPILDTVNTDICMLWDDADPCDKAYKEGLFREKLFKSSPDLYFKRVEFDLKQEPIKSSRYNPYIYFGVFEFEKFFPYISDLSYDTYCGFSMNHLGSYSDYAHFSKYKKIGNYHIIAYQSGGDCSWNVHYIIVNDKFDVLDELVLDVGCFNQRPEDEVEKDTIEKYMYYLDDYNNNLYGLDTVYYETKSSYVIKDTVSAQYYYIDNVLSRHYIVDENKGRFVLIYEKDNTLEPGRFHERMEPIERSW